MKTVWLGEPSDSENEEESPYESEPGGGRRRRLDKSNGYGYEEDWEREGSAAARVKVDPKTINWRGRLTEYCQKRDLTIPEVNEINTLGARGTFSFVCKFYWGKANCAPLLILRTCGTAKKKKYAKREAARLMCRRLSDLTEFERPVGNEHNPEDRGYWGPTFPACPRSANESGKVCPPIGYEDFDHSEPLPDVNDYELSNSINLSKRNSSWEDAYPSPKRRRVIRVPWRPSREERRSSRS